MNYKKLEKEVSKNAKKLDVRKYMGEHEGEYVIFNKGDAYFKSSFADAVKFGKEKFGEKVGFVVRKVSKQQPVFSSLVRL